MFCNDLDSILLCRIVMFQQFLQQVLQTRIQL